VRNGLLLAGATAAGLAAIVAIDRLLAIAAARVAAARIRQANQASGDLGVRIHGLAFLPRLLAGRYGEIEVTLGPCTIGGVVLSGLVAQLAQVRAPLPRLVAGRGVLAGRLTATATIPLTALASRLPDGLVLRLDGDDLRISGTILRMPVAGTLSVKADPAKISLTPKVTGVSAPIAFVIELPALSAGLTITEVRITGDGLEVVVRGTDVKLPAVHLRPG
jgi:hypothetical protein